MPTISLPLTVRDLREADLPSCSWAGTDLHLRSVAAELARAAAGEVDYLAVCPPSGLPLGIGGVDYTNAEGVGTLWQLGVHEAVRSCGIGTVLVGALEERVAGRGLGRVALKVEEGNPRARALYERLGYRVRGREPDAWDVEGPDGGVVRYETVCLLMGKDLR